MNIAEFILTAIFLGIWAVVWFFVARFLKKKGVWETPSHILAGIFGFIAGVVGIGLSFPFIGNSERSASSVQVTSETPEARAYSSKLRLEVVEESLWAWDPIDVRVTGGALLIVIQEDRVTDEVYKAVIMAGVCPVYWQYPNATLQVSEIRVLNRFGRQGYVLEGEADICHWLGKKKGGDRYISGVTRLHTNN